MSVNDDPRPQWWPDGWEWPPELSNEESLRKSLEPFIDVDDEYRNCKSFEDCCKVLFECNGQMKKFFGKKKMTTQSIKTWKVTRNFFWHTMKRQSVEIFIVTDERGVQVCSGRDIRSAVESALRIAAEQNCGAVQVVGE